MDVRQHMEEYEKKEKAHYEAYEELLRGLLSWFVDQQLPMAGLKTRVKSVPALAEKLYRKRKKYSDAPLYNDLTDLVGARLMVTTHGEVSQACRWIRRVFLVDEANSEDKLRSLRPTEFGYRSVHFVIQVPEDVLDRAGLPAQHPERARWQQLVGKVNAPKTGEATPFFRKAEIQVRTYLQHVWAEVLHDRLYKTSLQLPPPVHREASRLAALLEKADDLIGETLDRLDLYHTDHALGLDPTHEMEEIEMLQGLVDLDRLSEKVRLDAAVQLAGIYRLRQRWKDIAAMAELARKGDTYRHKALGVEVANALCQAHPAKAPAFEEGRKWLLEIARLDAKALDKREPLKDMVQALRAPTPKGAAEGDVQDDALRARAMIYYARSEMKKAGRVGQTERIARNLSFQAHLLSPHDPHIFGAYLVSEAVFSRSVDFCRPMARSIEAAVDRCRELAQVGAGGPWPYFTEAVLHLFLGRSTEALCAYCRGVLRCPAEDHTPIQSEVETLTYLLNTVNRTDSAFGEALQDALGTLELCLMARGIHPEGTRVPATNARYATGRPVLMVVGFADLDAQDPMYGRLEALLREALPHATGYVFCGGTDCGIPKIVGDCAPKAKDLELHAYVPLSLPIEVRLHPRYTPHKTEGNGFSILQPLVNWADLLQSGIAAQDVRVVGFGGGAISRFEYYLAAALGASVSMVEGFSGASREVLADPTMMRVVGVLPEDALTLKAYFMFRKEDIGRTQARIGGVPVDLDAAGKSIHEFYRRQVISASHSAMPWEELDETYKNSSRHQASFMAKLFEQEGLVIDRLDKTRPNRVTDLDQAIGADGVERLARFEHGRWCAERILQGWRYGAVRDNERFLHPDLVPWERLNEASREKDRQFVREMPANLERVGLGLYRVKDA
mgnify:CR=1 FL=1|uniref:RelA/SpoT domain-containing protein n=1 Tax=Desulfacinum infernum TaxID=35837 RepID=A0A832A4R8_9BACT